MSQFILVVEPPQTCWPKGYVVRSGHNSNSLNKTSLYATKNHLVPNQKRLHQNFIDLKKTLKLAGFKLVVLPFPDELNSNDGSHHDGVFIRDVGMNFKDIWIKANFSAKGRQLEAEVFAQMIKNKFNKEIITPPSESFIEFGEVYYLETADGTYYFGGLSRANQAGHLFVKSIIKPDIFVLIESSGFHLDTVLTPVLSYDNHLVAVIVSPEMISKSSLQALHQLPLKVMEVEAFDTIGLEGRGNYAVNCLVGPGVLVSGARFKTLGIHKQLEEFDIRFFTTALTDFNLSGGSVHCLTNEIVV